MGKPYKKEVSKIKKDLISIAEKKRDEFDLSKIKQLGIWKKKEKFTEIYKYPPYQAYDSLKFEELPEPKFKNEEAVIYNHFPFCLTKCVYCPFYSLIEETSPIKVKEYLTCIKKEIELLSQKKDLKKIKVKSVYFGGGTPTYIPIEDLEDYINFLKEKFDIKPGTEFASEASPETILTKEGEKKLSRLLDLGLNRLSIGVQDFNDEILKLIGRAHNSSEALKAIKTVKDVGFQNVNVDIIYGLPGQTRENWENTINLSSNIEVGSLTVAYLRIKPGERDVIHNKSMYWLFKNKPELFPTEDESFFFYLMMNERLKELGYKQRQCNWFTRSEKFVSRYLVERWQNLKDTIGFGVVASTSVGNIDYHNVNNVEDYVNAIKKSEFPFFKGKILTDDEMMRKKVAFGFKTDLIKKDYKDKFNANIREKFNDLLDKFINLKLCYETDKRFELTDLGRFLSDEICREFFSEDVKNRVKEYNKKLDEKVLNKEENKNE